MSGRIFGHTQQQVQQSFCLEAKKEHDHQRVFSSATRHTKSELMVNRKLPVDHLK